MTLQTVPPISMSDVATELGRVLPITLLDADVLTLAGKAGPPISLFDLLGKSNITTTLYPFSMLTGYSAPQPSVSVDIGYRNFAEPDLIGTMTPFSVEKFQIDEMLNDFSPLFGGYATSLRIFTLSTLVRESLVSMVLNGVTYRPSDPECTSFGYNAGNGRYSWIWTDKSAGIARDTTYPLNITLTI